MRTTYLCNVIATQCSLAFRIQLHGVLGCRRCMTGRDKGQRSGRLPEPDREGGAQGALTCW
jgi:hypothetical protein